MEINEEDAFKKKKMQPSVTEISNRGRVLTTAK